MEIFRQVISKATTMAVRAPLVLEKPGSEIRDRGWDVVFDHFTRVLYGMPHLLGLFPRLQIVALAISCGSCSVRQQLANETNEMRRRQRARINISQHKQWGLRLSRGMCTAL